MTVPIANHFTPEKHVTFYEVGAELKACVDGGDLLPVEEPTFCSSGQEGYRSTADRVARLLMNRHLRMDISHKGIKMVPISGESTWELVHDRECPEIPENLLHKQILFRRDGRISYFFETSVTTWNWVGKRESIRDFPHKISAIGESADRELLVACENGKVYYRGEPIFLEVNRRVKKILPASPTTCLIEFSDGSRIILDLQGRLVRPLPEAEKYFIFSNGKIVSFAENQLEGVPGEIEDVNKIGEDCLLIRDKDEKTVRLWNGIKNSQDKKIEFQRSWEEVGLSNFTLLPDGNFLLSDKKENAIFTLSILSGIDTSIDFMTVYITAFALLSDSKVMVGSTDFDSKFNVFHGCSPSICYKEKGRICSFVELVDGSVAAVYTTTPYKKKEIPSTTGILILRKKWHSRRVKKKEDISDSQRYLSAMASMEVAIRDGNAYRARKAYARIKKIGRPGSIEIVREFLSRFSFLKMSRQVERELFYQNGGYIPKLLSRYRERLILGEGDFSYTQALLKKQKDTHPYLARHIIATDLRKLEDDKVLSIVENLKEKGVKVCFGIDATRIHEVFRGLRFERIQWNCPFKFSEGDKDSFKKVLPKFFQASSYLQIMGDRIHVTLCQIEKHSLDPEEFWKTRQTENPIVIASSAAGYRLIRKRVFGPKRYPGYVHVMTDGRDHIKNRPGENQREFVFEKMPHNSLNSPENKTPDPGAPGSSQGRISPSCDPSKKNFHVQEDKDKDGKDRIYFVCSSDEDSSSYGSDDEF